MYFKIIADNNCPLYQEGELLSLSAKTLTCPANKETCLILVREMTKLLFELLDGSPEEEEASGKVYSCSGCSGLIKFQRLSKVPAGRDGSDSEKLQLDSEDKALLNEIRDYPLIRAIPDSVLYKVIRSFRKERLPANSIFISKGRSSLYLYLILSGDIVVSDDSLTIAHLGTGDICGEMSYLGGDVAAADVKTVTEAVVLSISGDAFSQLLDSIPELQLFMAKILVQRLAESNTSHFETFNACMSGWIRDMPPAELFQVFHMHQKTGVLSLDLPQGKAKVSFREGCVINAQYRKMTSQDAIFSMLKEREGRYTFTTGLSPEEMKAAEIGDFMMLLMEGIKRVDESGDEGK